MITPRTADDGLLALDSLPPSVMRPSPELLALQERGPFGRVRTPAGDEAWLVTRHAEVKQLLLDPRFGRSHPTPEKAPKYVLNPLLDLLSIHSNDPEEAKMLHAEFRSVMTPNFSARRVNSLAPRIDALAHRVVDDLVAKGAPADLHTEFSVPFALLALCELIGVPAEDRPWIEQLLHSMGQVGSGTSARENLDSLFAYMADLADRRRAEPEDDLITRMCAADPPNVEVGTMATGLLFAGLSPVSGRLELGVALLAQHRDQLAAALADPALMTTAVEEILRWAVSGSSVLPKYALADVTIGDMTIKSGELVLFDYTLANYDPRVYADPHRFDIGRSPNPHLSFSPGVWHCVGAPLVRVMFKSTLTMLFTRLPELRLAVPQEELRLQQGKLAGAFKELPVTW